MILCKIGIKYQYIGRAVCAHAHLFRKRPGCALIGACALIRTNTVCLFGNDSYSEQTLIGGFPIFVYFYFLFIYLFIFFCWFCKSVLKQHNLLWNSHMQTVHQIAASASFLISVHFSCYYL